MLFVRVLPQFGLAFFDNISDDFKFDKMLNRQNILKLLGSSFIHKYLLSILFIRSHSRKWHTVVTQTRRTLNSGIQLGENQPHCTFLCIELLILVKELSWEQCLYGVVREREGERWLHTWEHKFGKKWQIFIHLPQLVYVLSITVYITLK